MVSIDCYMVCTCTSLVNRQPLDPPTYNINKIDLWTVLQCFCNTLEHEFLQFWLCLTFLNLWLWTANGSCTYIFDPSVVMAV